MDKKAITATGFIALIMIAVWALGTFGGTAYLFYYGQPLMGIAVAALGLMAIPLVYKTIKDSLEL